MNDKLEKLIAKSEIYDLSCKYMRGLDRLDIELLKSVFHEDAWCDYGFIKSDAFEFTQFCMDALKEHHANHHMIGNILIEFSDNEDEAFGEVYFQAYHKVNENGQTNDIFISGRYLDRYEKRNGIWKIVYRSEIVDWSRTEPTNEPYFDTAPDCFRGGRQDDRVYQLEKRTNPN